MSVEGGARTTPEQQRSDRRLLIALGALAVTILIVGIVSGVVFSQGERTGEDVMIPGPEGEAAPLPGDPEADPPPPPDEVDVDD